MPRRPQKVFQKRGIPENIWKFLNDEHPDPGSEFEIFLLEGGGPELRKLWDENKIEIMAGWVSKHPGSRPTLWWDFDAPRWQDPYKEGVWFHGTLCEPRKRLGGTGTPNYEVLADVPHFARGIPTGWVSKSQEDYYNGRQVDIHGHKIGTNNEGDFKGKAIDPDDPPVFESEAAYLDRHGLLTASETRHIEKNPKLLEAERIKSENASTT